MGWVISAESFPYALPCWCWKAGRQHSLVAAQQPNRPTAGIYHFRWRASCRSRSTPTHITHNHDTNNYTPPAPSGEINFTGSHSELRFPGAAHAVCRPRRFLHTAWLLTLHHYGGSEDQQPLAAAGEGGGGSAPLLHPNTANIQEGAHLVLSLSHPGVKCQTLKHVSTVRACYRISE